ncbi:MAG: hypothetical protein P9F19_07230 [Candidatus Contendobacter sp.]|nr:hypothetical protein [Candidatus Contendobacter sp.]MDG4557163.1 hypothetical protein [Candidatus Contendobacter sp.]
MITRTSRPPHPWTRRLWKAGGLARRKPWLLLRLAGSSLLRLAERTLAGLLFQEPPRTARAPPIGPLPE